MNLKAPMKTVIRRRKTPPFLHFDAPFPPEVQDLAAAYGGETSPEGVRHVLSPERAVSWSGRMPLAFTNFAVAALWAADKALDDLPVPKSGCPGLEAELDALYWALCPLRSEPVDDQGVHALVRLYSQEGRTYAERRAHAGTQSVNRERCGRSPITIALERARAVANVARLFSVAAERPMRTRLERVVGFAAELHRTVEAAGEGLDCAVRDHLELRSEMSSLLAGVASD